MRSTFVKLRCAALTSSCTYSYAYGTHNSLQHYHSCVRGNFDIGGTCILWTCYWNWYKSLQWMHTVIWISSPENIGPFSQIRRSITLRLPFDHIHSQAGNNVQYFLHFFTLERLRIFPSPQFEKKKKRNKDSREERTWTEDHSLKNLRSIHLGYLRVDDCRWKKVDQNISNRAATDYLH